MGLERKKVRETLKVLKAKVSFGDSEAPSSLMLVKLTKHFLGHCPSQPSINQEWQVHVTDSPKVYRNDEISSGCKSKPPD